MTSNDAETGNGQNSTLDQQIEHLEEKIEALRRIASGEPSPAKGMAMLRKGRAKSDLVKAKNKRAEGEPK
jgi:hypothetical protein